MHAQQPVLFLSHGSPMTALGGDELSRVWSALSARLSKPAAILVVSAHWTTRLPILGGSAQPETIHDFGGFPDALYQLRYPAPGAPALAQHIRQKLSAAGITAGIDASRGLDHGAWVPLRALFPAADIPVLQLSVQPGCCARHHFALGTALKSLRGENILLVASGHLTHNLKEYFRQNAPQPAPESVAFRDWIHTCILARQIEPLFDWQQNAPHATFAHPTAEHFLPLFVALGAAGEKHVAEWLGGGWIGNSLAADNYLFD
jgi:4,5-DOPA dioxygenase extradiol